MREKKPPENDAIKRFFRKFAMETNDKVYPISSLGYSDKSTSIILPWILIPPYFADLRSKKVQKKDITPVDIPDMLTPVMHDTDPPWVLAYQS